MSRRPFSCPPRTARLAVAFACLLTPALAGPSTAGATARVHASVPATQSSIRDEIARVTRYWTPARMRSARPLDDAAGVATASYATVPDATAPPFPANGRLFVRQGKLRGFCSGTAINSPTRQLVLTAGHCVNSGPVDRQRDSIWSRFLEFVPAYDDGVAPFGAFVAQQGKVFALRQWARGDNPNFDVGAFLASPNASGQNVADAVGGGVTIITDQSRHQQFQTFGYPGMTNQLQECDSPYVGDDTLTYPLSGPPTMAIGCYWRPGASGGAWLIANGTEINGLTSYSHRNNHTHTFSPYFGRGNVGKLVAGL